MATTPPSLPVNGNLAKRKFALDVVKFVGPSIVALFVAYTTVVSTRSAKEQQAIDLKEQVIELKAQVERNRQLLETNRDRYATKQEVKDAVEAQTKMMDRIYDEIRRMR